jgi:hypothetical protein
MTEKQHRETARTGSILSCPIHPRKHSLNDTPNPFVNPLNNRRSAAAVAVNNFINLFPFS